LGLIIEKIDEKPYHEAVHARFLDSLGLTTFAHPPYDNLPLPVANVWLSNGAGSSNDSGDYIAQWNSFNQAMGPSGCWFATAADLARWMYAYQSSDVLTDSMLLQCRTTVPSQPAGTNYGLGLMERKFQNQTAYGHGGDLGYCANAYYFPNKDLSIAVLNNDAVKNSWQVAPTIQVLYKAVLDYMMLSPSNEPVEPMATKTDIEVYPNPITSEFVIDATLTEQFKSVQCEMVNSFGMTISVFPNVLPNGLTIHTPLRLAQPVPQGVYFLRLYGEGRFLGAKRVVVLANQ
jgi:CubicO group peptidase (beta-lactamase class C family)